ncbi:MAG: AAA family ATPase [Thermodesulfobacteriota bacterium]
MPARFPSVRFCRMVAAFLVAVSKTTKFFFGDFVLDTAEERLLRGATPLGLTHKSLAVLQCLVERAGTLVTKEQLLESVWQGIAVGDAVLKVHVGEIRKALGDDARAPRYVETLHRRGYRFLLRVDAVAGHDQSTPAAPAPARPPVPSVEPVGRGAVLDELTQAWLRASAGTRQVVFVSGEPGIGKTAAVDAFAARLAATPTVRVARGQCLERHGASEPYLPVLEALERLCREPARPRIDELLARWAPTWLVQMPSLVEAGEAARLRHETLGATPERMLREMTEALDAVTRETTLVLVLEDLHWSDPSTVDLIVALATRREPARLLLIGTYRPAELRAREHPLDQARHDLALRRQCREIALGLLDESDVGGIVARRFPALEGTELARALHRRTDGNPLFVVNVLDFLVASGRIADRDGSCALAVPAEDAVRDVPDTLRQLVESQVARLAPGLQRLLEAGSVVGVETLASVVAAAVGRDVVDVEDACERLSRDGHLLARGAPRELPDGSVSSVYRFQHALYRQVLYERLAPARRVLLHGRVARCEEALHGARADEIAAQLALHYELAREPQPAIHHLCVAADNATRRFALREAGELLARAFGLLPLLPADVEPARRLELLQRRGAQRRAAGESSAAADDFAAMAALARDRKLADLEVHALLLESSALGLVDRPRCLAAAERAVAREGASDLMLAVARGYRAYWSHRLAGYDERDARACAEALDVVRGLGLPGPLALFLHMNGCFQSLRAEYRAASDAAAEGQRLAREVGDGFAYQLCAQLRATVLLHLGELGEALRVLHDLLALAERNGHAPGALGARALIAWLLAEVGAFVRARRLAEEALAAAQRLTHPYGLVLGQLVVAIADLGQGRAAAAARRLDDLRARLEREPDLREWAFLLPLHAWSGEAKLVLGDRPGTVAAARTLCELAGRPGERTYRMLGSRLLAEAALAGGDLEAADAEVGHALPLAVAGEAPLGAWRLLATAARVAERRAERALARRRRAESEGVLRGLAASLQDEPTLQRALLRRPDARAVLSAGPRRAARA